VYCANGSSDLDTTFAEGWMNAVLIDSTQAAAGAAVRSHAARGQDDRPDVPAAAPASSLLTAPHPGPAVGFQESSRADRGSTMTEQDALDELSHMSYLHRRLDDCK
jgi:hypothetical protein